MRSVLHLTAACKYIRRILREMEEPTVKSDRTTVLRQTVALRSGGWWNGST